MFRFTQHLHDEKDPSMSELCEILQLSSVQLIENQSIGETEIRVHDIKDTLCERCRRYPGSRKDGLCTRCAEVLRCGINETVTATGK